MSDREKLIELLDETFDKQYDRNLVITARNTADHLISNGVTVGVDTKPLKQYLTQIDEYAGLKLKYLVFKADTGERIENCFVLRPDKDYAAVEALRAYAEATDNKTLADDIYNWVGNGVTVKKWIPVSERLPEEHVLVLCRWRRMSEEAFYGFARYQGGGTWYVSNEGMPTVTHWMPLPEPPKECE